MCHTGDLAAAEVKVAEASTDSAETSTEIFAETTLRFGIQETSYSMYFYVELF